MSGGRRSLRLLGEKILKMKSRKYHFNYSRSGGGGALLELDTGRIWWQVNEARGMEAIASAFSGVRKLYWSCVDTRPRYGATIWLSLSYFTVAVYTEILAASVVFCYILNDIFKSIKLLIVRVISCFPGCREFLVSLFFFFFFLVLKANSNRKNQCRDLTSVTFDRDPVYYYPFLLRSSFYFSPVNCDEVLYKLCPYAY